MSIDLPPKDDSEETREQWVSRQTEVSLAAALALMRVSLDGGAEQVAKVTQILEGVAERQGVEGLYAVHRALAETFTVMTGLGADLRNARERGEDQAHVGMMMVYVDRETGERTWVSAERYAQEHGAENGRGLVAASRFLVANANDDHGMTRALFDEFTDAADPGMLMGLLGIVSRTCAPYLADMEQYQADGTDAMDGVIQHTVQAILRRDRVRVAEISHAVRHRGEDAYFALHVALAEKVAELTQGTPGTRYAVQIEVTVAGNDGDENVDPGDITEEPARTIVLVSRFAGAVLSGDLAAARELFDAHTADGAETLMMGLCAMVDTVAEAAAQNAVDEALGGSVDG